MNASRAYVYAVAKACDRGDITRDDAACAVLYASEKATQCALDAIQLLGGNGYINDYPTARLLRDAKLYEIGAGTSEIRRMLIGRELFEKSMQGLVRNISCHCEKQRDEAIHPYFLCCTMDCFASLAMT